MRGHIISLFRLPTLPVHAEMPLAARRCVVCALFAFLSLHANAASIDASKNKQQSRRSRKVGPAVVAGQHRLLQQHQQPGYPNYPSWPHSPPYSPGKWSSGGCSKYMQVHTPRPSTSFLEGCLLHTSHYQYRYRYSTVYCTASAAIQILILN